MGKEGGVFRGKEDGGGSDGASEGPGDAGQKKVKLLQEDSTYKSWKRKALCRTERSQEVNKGVTVIVS